ncbi:MAG: type II toxin-antitoxin system HicA family toxin [Rubrobacter sp.]|nr:type II toxin-antitoxin system HicA family toxin [Rubrobacter sp.]
MPAFGPVKRLDLVRYLRELDFEGPYSGGKHQYMIRSQTRIRIPNPHRGDISRGLLQRILAQASVSKEEWEKL